jgi:regulator of protease activity HflC (stomatin/prohibitin superfamily)
LTRLGYLVVIVPLLVLWFFIFCFRTVNAGQVGIVTRFGEVNRVQESGIAIKMPYPIERLEKMEIRVQKEEQDATAATSDLQDVTGKLALNYALDNETALRVYKELGKDYKNRVVIPTLQESFKAASANYTANELITKRPEVKGKAYEIIKERLSKYGIRVVDLNVVDLQYSKAFNDAIEAKQVAQQQAEKAKQDLVRIQVEAEQAITAARGQAEAQRLQRETLTGELVQLKQIESQNRAIDKWNGVFPTTYAGSNGNFLFNIPGKP